MRKENLFQKKAWFYKYKERVNQQLDDFYATIPDSGLSPREQYLYDTAQNQFKMLYELIDRSQDLIDTELMKIRDTPEQKKNADQLI
ncbi:MAG: hypothetical protein K0Q48_589 [Bacillota bacterium]|jgi:hypothetical protein|nr:hypothetical protein [Bacillota bacterium]